MQRLTTTCNMVSSRSSHHGKLTTSCQCLEIWAVGSITWPFFGRFRVNNLAMVGSITWPSFFEPIKNRGFWRFFCAQFSGGGAKLALKKNGQKRGFRKKNVHLFLGSFGFTSLLLHDGTRCFRRVCKKPYKSRVFWPNLLLDAEETEKRRKKGPKKVTPKFWVALKTGRK